MTITVNTPDGGVASFPDDTSTDTITSAMKAKFGGPDTSEKPWLSLTGTDKIGELVGKMADTATAGFGASALDKLGLGQGPGGQTVRSQVEAAGQDLGPVLSGAADVAGYAIGPGKLGVGARLARGAEGLGLGARAAQAAGTAGEAGLAATAGDIGHGETPGWDVPISMGLGGGLGMAIGNRGRALGPALERATSVSQAEGPTAGVRDFIGPDVAPPKALGEDVLQANRDAAYQKLESTPISPKPVSKAIGDALNDLTPGQQAGLSDAFNSRVSQVNDIINSGQPLSLGDVDNFQRTIGSGVRSSADQVAGAKVGEALRALGGQPMADAQLAQGQLADSVRLNQQLKNVGWIGDPSQAFADAARGTAPGARTVYSPAGRSAMEDLANAAPSDFNKAMRTGIAMGINHGVGLAGGGAFGHFLGEGGLGALVGAYKGTGPMHPGQAAVRLITNMNARRAMRAALAATSTGLPATADMFKNTPWVSQAARQGLYANEAAGP